MKKLLALALVAVIATGAMAQTSEDNMMGVFFTDDVAAIMDAMGDDLHPFTNHVNAFAPFNAYIVVLNPTVDTIGAYECSVNAVGPFFLAVTGPNGWTNFGTPNNHLVGFQAPVPAVGGAVVCSIQMLYTGVDTVLIEMGPSDPASIAGVPAIADGANPDILVGCNLTSDGGYVATINGEGVVSTEAHSLTSVKALFN